MVKTDSVDCELLNKVIAINTDGVELSDYLAKTFEIFKKYYPDIYLAVYLFNTKKTTSKKLSLNGNSIIQITEVTLPYYEKIVDIIKKNDGEHSYRQLNDNLAVYTLTKFSQVLGLIEIQSKQKLKDITNFPKFELFLFSHRITRCIVSFTNQVAIDALIEVNAKLEQVLDEKEKSLRMETEAHLLSSKMATLGTLTAGIAHEINNPLTIIQAKIYHLRKNLEKKNSLDENVNSEIEKVLSTTQRIGKIIKGLKSFSRNSGADPMESVSLNEIIKNALDLCQEKIKSYGIQLSIQTDTGLDYEVLAREAQIVQVIMNLLNNSCEAISDMNLGNEESRWISISIKKIKDNVGVVFTDCGKGISASIAEKIMTPFFTTKPIGVGTGLGLSICKSIVENHHGQFYYNSNCQNTQFIMEIPYLRLIENKNTINV